VKAKDAWEWYGGNAPYFGVLSYPAFHDAVNEGPVRDAFFALGESEVDEAFDIIRSEFDPAFAPRHALDFGCGVGRLSMALARRCARVTGLDASDGMLSEARRSAAAFGLANTRFESSRNGVPVLETPPDFIMSVIVFQHIPRSLGMPLLQEILGRLAPGGAGVIEMPLDRPFRERYNHRKDIITRAFHRRIDALRGRKAEAPAMEMNAYDMDACLAVIRDAGCSRVGLRFRDHAGFKAALLSFRKDAG
jgi:SAM-dependent methyltransferase